MKPLHSSEQKKSWNAEQAAILHHICLCVRTRVQRGQSTFKAIRHFSRKWNGRPLKFHKSRKLRIAESTLLHKYKKWRLYGERPDVFRLKYSGARRRIPSPVLIRFINCVAVNEFPSCKAAWKAFCRRPGNSGPGKVRLGYDALMWNLPDGFWRKVKAAHQSKRLAEQTINMGRLAAIVEIQKSVPAKLPQRKAPNFQI